MTKYLKLARRHCKWTAVAILVAIISASYCYVFAFGDWPGLSVALGCLCALSVFIALTQGKESTRCLSIHLRWARSDRENNQ